MQTTLTVNKHLLFFLILCLATPVAIANTLNSNLFTVDTYKHPVKIKYRGAPLQLNNKLSKDWRLVDDLFSLNKPFNINNKKYIWFIVKTPSKPKSFGKGNCGAGTEDFAYLVEIQEKTLIYTDRFQLQSCLNNITIGYGEDLTQESMATYLSQNNLHFNQTLFNDSKTNVKELLLKPHSKKIIIQKISEHTED